MDRARSVPCLRIAISIIVHLNGGMCTKGNYQTPNAGWVGALLPLPAAEAEAEAEATAAAAAAAAAAAWLPPHSLHLVRILLCTHI
jgi:hypothetical protein